MAAGSAKVELLKEGVPNAELRLLIWESLSAVERGVECGLLRCDKYDDGPMIARCTGKCGGKEQWKEPQWKNQGSKIAAHVLKCTGISISTSQRKESKSKAGERDAPIPPHEAVENLMRGANAVMDVRVLEKMAGECFDDDEETRRGPFPCKNGCERQVWVLSILPEEATPKCWYCISRERDSPAPVPPPRIKESLRNVLWLVLSTLRDLDLLSPNVLESLFQISVSPRAGEESSNQDQMLVEQQAYESIMESEDYLCGFVGVLEDRLSDWGSFELINKSTSLSKEEQNTLEMLMTTLYELLEHKMRAENAAGSAPDQMYT
ncbi:hypothetical protein M427DRAFT_142677 [Gonapodya prolifera JEL478]|uniref:Uncharacterized protein n=1 Tax=Gonapodya prolifera (strain JEL478) TaxID=1344416 RepID=A0A139AWU3_GONPJ|nr:hypothetical protein M427DRAFT_142677 [Gonapodya prolifera JEL478]|eukprot:KXS21053.1 hypothetical protein M427DRAFT_142677 [Gonapodya prolifera JEL478]